jgi:2-aminomuconate deaminase
MTEKFDSDKAPLPVGKYPHALRVGPFLYLSGVGPRSRNSSDIPGVTLDDEGRIVSYDIAAQTHAVMENVRLVLESAGASWEDLVDITVFLTNMKDDFRTYNEIYASYFTSNPPCRTTVEVNALPTPIAIELKCIAYLGS